MTGGPGYNDLFGTTQSNANILASPSVKGITVFVPWGQIDNNSSGPCQETSTSSTCAWTNVDPQLWAYIQGTNNNGLASHYEKLNLIVEMIPEGSTSSNGVPAYVFQPGTYASWCPTCLTTQPQDVATCSEWSGADSAPTCSTNGTVPPAQPCPTSEIKAGVWNANTCRLTGSGSGVNNCPNQAEVGQDFSGYPVLYETPIMTAFQVFVDTLLKHYSPAGDASSSGPAIGSHIGYIRIGLSSGGENFPVCAQTLVNNSTTGVWPSHQGLSYDLSIPNQGISPDWYQTSPNCPTGGEASCQGKYAYISGSLDGVQFDGPGYVATMFAAFQASRAKYATSAFNPQVVANAHSGPPVLTDMSYADQEAQIFIGSMVPGYCGYCGESGFGQESLSEYDVWSLPIGRPCDDDWCALFKQYSPNYAANYYLQTTIPNLQAVYSIQSITTGNGKYPQGLVTCAPPPAPSCTNFNSNPPAFSPGGLYNEEGFAYTASNGTTSSYKVANNGKDGNGNAVGILSATQFTCDTTTQCLAAGNTTLYTGDYIPDTIPFAAKNHASTIEVYFCDWEFALNSRSSPSTTGCQNYDTTYSPKYASILGPP